MRHYFVYITANWTGSTLYVGMTNDVARRLWEHRGKVTAGFTARYQLNKLVLMESFGSPADAIAREKQIKGWRRSKKVALIEASNPQWKDLAPKLGLPPLDRLDD